MFFGRITLALATITAAAALPMRLPLLIRHVSQRGDANTTAVNATIPTVGGPGSNLTVTNSTISTGSTSNSTSSTIPQSGTNKLVMAHFMVGNTYSYTQATWKKDIALAQTGSIDAFALNIGSDSWQPARVADAYAAAQDLGTGFKLFISFDMTVLPGSSASDGAALQQYIKEYTNHPNQLKYDGKVFASTFSGETSQFGHPSAAEGWKAEFVDPLDSSGTPVYFMPALFIDPATIASTWGQIVSGIFDWNAGWPTGLTSQNLGVVGQAGALTASVTDHVKSLVGSLTPDTPIISALKDNAGLTYMASVSPFFFTHYGADTYNKNWIYVSDDHLYSSRWDTLIQNRDKIDFAEIITWNDYGESSYIGGIGQDQPKSNAWVDGFDHTGLIPLTSYYATAFKTGAYPTITKDTVVLAARPHTKSAEAANDDVGKPTNWELAQDKFWADFLLTAPATVVLSTSDSQSTTFQAAAGAGRFSMALNAGDYMSATVARNGQTVLTCKPDNFTFVDNPQTYNFNSFVFGCTEP